MPLFADETFLEVLATLSLSALAGLTPLIVGIRWGHLTMGVIFGTLSAGAVVQFGGLFGGALALGLVGLILCRPRRVLTRRDEPPKKP